MDDPVLMNQSRMQFLKTDDNRRLMHWVVETEDLFSRTERLKISENICKEYVSVMIENLMNIRLSGGKILKNFAIELKLFERDFINIAIHAPMMHGLFEKDFSGNFRVFTKLIFIHYCYITRHIGIEKSKEDNLIMSSIEILNLLKKIRNELN